MLKLILTISLTIMLCACSHLPNKFDCPIKGKRICKRLDQINAMVDKKQLPIDERAANHHQAKTYFNDHTSRYLYADYHKNVYKHSKQQLTIWLQEYIDRNGYEHSGHIIYYPSRINAAGKINA